MTEPILPSVKPLPVKDRLAAVYAEKGNLDVIDGARVVVDVSGVRTRTLRQEAGSSSSRRKQMALNQNNG